MFCLYGTTFCLLFLHRKNAALGINSSPLSPLAVQIDRLFLSRSARQGTSVSACEGVSVPRLRRTIHGQRLKSYGFIINLKTAKQIGLTIVRHDGAEGRPRWSPRRSLTARGMREGPSESTGRGRLQTTVSCSGKESGW